jgi:hypothetical protein
MRNVDRKSNFHVAAGDFDMTLGIALAAFFGVTITAAVVWHKLSPRVDNLLARDDFLKQDVFTGKD